MRTENERQHVGTSRWERRALAAGLLFGALQLAAVAFSMLVVVPAHAPIDAPPAETAEALAAHTTLIAVGTYLFVVPTPFLLLFLGGLFALLRRADVDGAASGGAVLAAAALAAGTAAAVMGPTGAVISGIAGETARLGGDPAVVKQLDGITPLMMALTGLPHAVLIGAALAAFRRRPLPRWVVWLGATVALLGLAGSATIALNALFPLVVLEMALFPVWILALTIVLLRPRA